MTTSAWAILYWNALHCIALYCMIWYGMVWYGMVWYGMVWNGMVWYGMVWYGMVWYGMVWYGMVWYCIVWSSCISYCTESTRKRVQICHDIVPYFFVSVHERAVSSESCNLIGSGSGENFPISDHNHGNRAKTKLKNNTRRLNSGIFLWLKVANFLSTPICKCVVNGKSNKEG